MRVTVVSPLGRCTGAAELSDLGCAVREAMVVAPPEEIVHTADLVLVEAGDDGDLGGFVVRRIRSVSARVPLLLATAVSQLPRIDPAWGHDDFVLQPYIPQELYARMRAAEWRSSEFSHAERIKLGALLIDLDAHAISIAGRTIPLTLREFELLVFLARGRGRLQTRERILARVWEQRHAGRSRSLDVHIRRLRSKLGGAVHIETVRGMGFKLDLP